LDRRNKIADAELKRRPEAIGGLIGVLAIRAVSVESGPKQVIATLLEVLLAVLRLDFAYARLDDSTEELPIVLERTARSTERVAGRCEMEAAIAVGPTDSAQASPLIVRRALRDGQISIARLRLGCHDETGCVVAGSRRAGFPTLAERLLLGVAVNQAAVSLREARLLSEQRRLAAELDRKLAQRLVILERRLAFLQQLELAV